MLAFDLLMLNGDDLRRKTYRERKAALRKLLRHDRGIQYVEHAEGHGDKMLANRPTQPANTLRSHPARCSTSSAQVHRPATSY
jgi:hypothetical protein